MDDKDTIISKSLNKAFKGGISGATAMVCQVGSLMWLRTTMNYQYRYGYSTSTAIKKLYAEEFGVTYPLFAKKSLADNPLFTYLTTHASERVRGEISWNYTKFLVNTKGQVVHRFGPRANPISFEDKLIALLQ